MTMAKNSSENLCDDVVWPPGFRFHPTDEELILYYLKRKICRRRLKLDIIAEVDVYKHEPEELPGLCLLKNGDRQWFFFSPRDRKYPNGSRSNRATRNGYWKATGKDRIITCNSRNVGVKKTLVFYRGRAPSGARTDWVMHEYTLEEDELKRCQNVQDYYAIYKMFKKSGPGPKNGEQYGAPFREEDWVDDEITSNSDQANNARQVNNDVANDDFTNVEVDPFFNNIDEIMNGIVAVSPGPPPQPANVFDFEQALSQFVGEEETHSTIVHGSFAETTYTEPCTTYGVSSQHNGLEASFNVKQTDTRGLLEWDVPEVTSTANTIDMPPALTEDDFLEMNDLLGPNPDQGINDLLPLPLIDDRLPDNSQLREGDGLSEFDLYYDTDSFLRDLGPTDQYHGVPSDAYPKSHDDGLLYQVGFQVQPCLDSASAFENEMWGYDPSTCFPTTTVPNQGPIPSTTSGVVCAGSNQNESGKESEGGQPWFSSSALWSFVESIPAAPASAAESALVNKAFQRMSSFSRVRLNPKSTITAVGSVSSGSGYAGVRGRVKGFFFLSFLAALFAVVCVFIGSNVGNSHCRINL